MSYKYKTGKQGVLYGADREQGVVYVSCRNHVVTYTIKAGVKGKGKVVAKASAVITSRYGLYDAEMQVINALKEALGCVVFGVTIGIPYKSYCNFERDI